MAEQLEPEYGSGFSKRQVELIQQFYRTFPIANALYSQLIWSQYKLLQLTASFEFLLKTFQIKIRCAIDEITVSGEDISLKNKELFVLRKHLGGIFNNTSTIK
ncbi:hypothetical protein [Chitinophaga sp. CF118]|uniref:DUF1016 N-terminal domain-containing protein n=1 Tax=Chitinophaga sp. CF118 TaxID=1884367 RepID=UPI001C43563A|nr:hypothetical protein [Chitinophaga sp. CF118]